MKGLRMISVKKMKSRRENIMIARMSLIPSNKSKLEKYSVMMSFKIKRKAKSSTVFISKAEFSTTIQD